MTLGLRRGVGSRALFAVSLLGLTVLGLTVLGLQAVSSAASPAARSAAGPDKVLVPKKLGELDCNGQSPIQQTLRSSMPCTDIRGFAGTTTANTWGGRFYQKYGESAPAFRREVNRLSLTDGAGSRRTPG